MTKTEAFKTIQTEVKALVADKDLSEDALSRLTLMVCAAHVIAAVHECRPVDPHAALRDVFRAR